jgi:hypothetical protein
MLLSLLRPLALHGNAITLTITNTSISAITMTLTQVYSLLRQSKISPQMVLCHLETLDSEGKIKNMSPRMLASEVVRLEEAAVEHDRLVEELLDFFADSRLIKSAVGAVVSKSIQDLVDGMAVVVSPEDVEMLLEEGGLFTLMHLQHMERSREQYPDMSALKSGLAARERKSILRRQDVFTFLCSAALDLQASIDQSDAFEASVSHEGYTVNIRFTIKPEVRYIVVTPLLHYCYTVITISSHCCYTVITLLLECCYTILTLLSHTVGGGLAVCAVPRARGICGGRGLTRGSQRHLQCKSRGRVTVPSVALLPPR